MKSDLRGLRRAGSKELVVATAIFAATAILTALSPPPPSAAAAENEVTATGSDFGRTTRVRLEVSPGQAGLNTFTLHVLEGFRPDTVRLRFTYDEGGAIGPSELALHRSKDVWTATDANLSLEGRWKVSVVLQGRTTSAEVPLEIATKCVTTSVPGGKGPIVYSQTLSGGNSDQTYADPGKAGANEIHFTFFDTKGNELPIEDAPDISAWRPGHDARSLAVRRFSPGHFIASGRLVRGHWRFDAVARPKTGDQPLRACFEQDI